MAQTMTTQELLDRIDRLSHRSNLNPDEQRELQELARRAADIVCTVENAKASGAQD